MQGSALRTLESRYWRSRHRLNAEASDRKAELCLPHRHLIPGSPCTAELRVGSSETVRRSRANHAARGRSSAMCEGFEYLRLANLYGCPSLEVIQAMLILETAIANDCNPGVALKLLGTLFA